MNGDRDLVETFCNELNQIDFSCDVAVCPPSPYLALFNAETFSLGAQDVSAQDNGAHTGDISTSMVVEMGCKYVIVGHSERRQDHSESDAEVAEKAKRAVADSLIPVICVGETAEIREENKVESFIGRQLEALTGVLTPAQFSNCVIAYEPIWAIGTGKTASPEQAQQVHEFIRAQLARWDEPLAATIRIVYGGSVKADNATELFGQPDVDGGLIGGASLKVKDFIAICQAAN